MTSKTPQQQIEELYTRALEHVAKHKALRPRLMETLREIRKLRHFVNRGLRKKYGTK